MSTFEIENIGVYDDNYMDIDIIEDIVKVNRQEDAFYIVDIGYIARQHKKWLSAMPRVIPYYAIKCNPNEDVIKILASLNSKFDCASKEEICQVMQAGVSCDRIIYANPIKYHSHIEFAREVGVQTLIVDNPAEVLKIKKIYPEAELVIRLAIEADSCGVQLNKKFGCDLASGVKSLMTLIKKQMMNLRGFSFHLGSPCWDSNAYGRAIKICAELIEAAKLMGLGNVNLIDIGGGIPALQENLFYEIAESVNTAIQHLDSSIEVISEPGRYYVEPAFILATLIHSKRILSNGEQARRHYYINDGVFGSFLDELLHIAKRTPIPLSHLGGDLFSSIIWGPTLDSHDCIIDDMMLPELNIGDWIIWRNMGSYTLSTATSFNGYGPPMVYPIIRRNDLSKVLGDISLLPKLDNLTNTNDEESDSNSDMTQTSC